MKNVSKRKEIKNILSELKKGMKDKLVNVVRASYEYSDYISRLRELGVEIELPITYFDTNSAPYEALAVVINATENYLNRWANILKFIFKDIILPLAISILTSIVAFNIGG